MSAKSPLSRAHRRHPSGASAGKSIKTTIKSDSSSARSLISTLSASLRKSGLTSPRGSRISRLESHDSLRSTRHDDDTGHSTTLDNSAFRHIVSDVVGKFSDNITEASTPRKSHTFERPLSSGGTSEESATTRNRDNIFAEFTTPTTAPTTPSGTPFHDNLKTRASTSPTQKSKLPVLKYLRRLSPLPSPARIITKMHTTSPSKVSRMSKVRLSSAPTSNKCGSVIPIPISISTRPAISGGRIPVRKSR